MEAGLQSVAEQFVALFGSNGSLDSGNVSAFLSSMRMDKGLARQLEKRGECPGHNFSSQHWYQPSKLADLILAVWQTAQTPACHFDSAAGRKNDTAADHAGNSPLQVWGYGMLCVTIINLCAALGVLFMPLIGHRLYRMIMVFMTSLAAGSLLATALLILLPDSLQLALIHEGLMQEPFSTGWEQFLSEHPWYIWRCCAVFGGIYLFFALERLLKELLVWKNHGKAGHSHGASATPAPTDGGCTATIELIGKEGATATADAATAAATGSRLARVQPVAWMILLGDALHNFIDGLSIGAGFGKSSLTGLSISLAVLCEELPHELGDFAILLGAGMSVPMALAANLLSACSCYVGFVAGVLLGEMAGAGVWIFAVGGGMFLYISLVDMMPEVNQAMDTDEARRIGKGKIFFLQNVGLLFGFGSILLIAIYGGDIKLG